MPKRNRFDRYDAENSTYEGEANPVAVVYESAQNFPEKVTALEAAIAEYSSLLEWADIYRGDPAAEHFAKKIFRLEREAWHILHYFQTKAINLADLINFADSHDYSISDYQRGEAYAEYEMICAAFGSTLTRRVEMKEYTNLLAAA